MKYFLLVIVSIFTINTEAKQATFEKVELDTICLNSSTWDSFSEFYAWKDCENIAKSLQQLSDQNIIFHDLQCHYARGKKNRCGKYGADISPSIVFVNGKQSYEFAETRTSDSCSQIQSNFAYLSSDQIVFLVDCRKLKPSQAGEPTEFTNKYKVKIFINPTANKDTK